MKFNPAAIVAVAFLLLSLGFASYHYGSTTSIEYRGEQVKLAKPYWSYDAYKADPNNLSPDEIPRVEKMMTEAQLPPTFKSREEFRRSVFDLAFPGYSVGNSGDFSQTDGSLLSAMFVEVPGVQKVRMFVMQKSGMNLALLDSPVMKGDSKSVSKIILEGKTLKYLDKSGTVLREATLPN